MRIPHVILTLGLIVHAGALAAAQQSACARCRIVEPASAWRSRSDAAPR
jgi:hypothetical protein